MRAAQLQSASPESPVELDVIAEVAAGDTFEGDIPEGACVRIMTGAPLPAAADAVVKYEIVRNVEGDGRPGSRVAFEAPAKLRGNVREAGGGARRRGRRSRRRGHQRRRRGLSGRLRRDRGSHPAPSACGHHLHRQRARAAHPGSRRGQDPQFQRLCAGRGRPRRGRASHHSLEALKVAVLEAVREYDFVVTSGGASDGDFDFIKPCVEQTGELLMTRVNMRPGKAQTFGLVNGTPVFGLPGNPAAAYCGFEMLIRPALRKMQGYSNLQRPLVKARLARDAKKGDARRIYLRATITKDADGAYAVEPAKNQSSGLFGVIQRSNCLAVLPEGGEGRTAGSLVECILLDVNEDVCL